jgi:hypothetical protein
MLESPASCFAFRYGASLNMTASFMRRLLIETIDENPHFYQFTVAAQSSYPLSQSWSDPADPNNQWNF